MKKNKINNKQKKSIKRIMQINFLIGFFGFLISFFLASFLFIRIRLIPSEQKEVEDRNREKLISAELSINSTVDKVDSLSRVFMSDSQVQDTLRSTKSYFDTTVQNSMKDVAYKTILNNYSGIHSVILIPKNPINENYDSHLSWGRGSIMIKEDLFFQNWKSKILDSKKSYHIFSDSSETFVFLHEANIVTFSRVIYDFHNLVDVNGVLLINFDVKRLFEDYSKINDEKEGLILLNDKGDVVYSMIDSEDQKLISQYKEKIVSSLKSGNNDITNVIKYNKLISWKPCMDSSMVLVSVSDQKKIDSLFTFELKLIYLFSIVILLICFFVMSKRLNSHVNNPISILADKMENVLNKRDQHDRYRISDININTDSKEIDILYGSINKMISEINQYMAESLEQVRRTEQAELKVLQEQIKPHFLYNTLYAIMAMADANEDYQVVEAVETLAFFYRKFLSNGQETVTVEDEIDIVKNYIKLIKYRYGDLFDEEFEVDEDLKKVEVIKLILQPLVENSVYHGIREKGEHGLIRISVIKNSGKVHFKVYDTGMGMNNEQIKKLLSGENQKSFGFKGTIDRIKNFYNYDKDDIVCIRSVEGEFCEVDIMIPIDRFLR